MGVTWNRNSEYGGLPAIATGDRLVLHTDHGFRYSVTAEVIRVDGDRIEASVLGVFDRNGAGEIVGGEIVALVGSHVVVSRANVFEVLKKT